MMVIKDPEILTRFHGFRMCEGCGIADWCDAAHVYSRGAGGPDVFFNLVSLGNGMLSQCRCHQKSHDGNGPDLTKLVQIVAARERCTTNDVDMLVDGIRWILPKEPTFYQLREWLNTLSPRACEMAEQVPALSRILLGDAA